MDSNLRTKIVHERDRAIHKASEAQGAWLCAIDVEARKTAFQRSILFDGYVQALTDVLSWMDTVPVSTKGARPPSAADRIEAHLALHPEDNALSHRELAGRVGLSKTAVANWRTASTGGGQ